MNILERIADFCFAHEHCEDCPLYITELKYQFDYPRCIFWDTPCSWQIEKIMEIIEPKNAK